MPVLLSVAWERLPKSALLNRKEGATEQFKQGRHGAAVGRIGCVVCAVVAAGEAMGMHTRTIKQAAEMGSA